MDKNQTFLDPFNPSQKGQKVFFGGKRNPNFQTNNLPLTRLWYRVLSSYLSYTVSVQAEDVPKAILIDLVKEEEKPNQNLADENTPKKNISMTI